MGMLCTHHIQRRLAENRVLMIDDIYPHWHFSPRIATTVIPLILDSAVVSIRGRPQKEQRSHTARTRLTASTRRSPSAFEWTEAALPIRRSARSYTGKSGGTDGTVLN
jgi:hypothetical protein